MNSKAVFGFVVFWLHLIPTLALIRVGGLFNIPPENGINIQEYAFRYAMKIASEEFQVANFIFEAEVQTYEPKKNSFKAGRAVCSLLKDGVAGIFGPQYGESYYTVQAICDHKEIPHIITRWEMEARQGACAINLYPYAKVLSKVFADVISLWDWRKYTILYENYESLMRISDLILADFNNTVEVHLKQLVPDEKSSYRNVLRSVKESDIQNIIIDCSLDLLPEILMQAQQVGLMGSDHRFLITNLDFHTLDLENFKYGETNITGFRMVDPTHQTVIDVMEGFQTFIRQQTNTEYALNTLPLGSALMIDAVMLYSKAVVAILGTAEKREISPVPCGSPHAWPHGFSIINHMKMSMMNGLTGIIKFDHQGFRSQFDIHIVELVEDGIINVGKWTEDGIILDRQTKGNQIVGNSLSLRNMTFNVLIPMTKPYGMLVKSYDKLQGNERFEGYCIDLIKHLSLISDNFSYNFIVSDSGNSGSPKTNPDKTVTWDGMVGDILTGRADLACGDLTISREREEVVDFTSRFMNLGVAILYKKPKSDPPGFFSFLSPFKTEVWILVITAYVSVSLMFFIMGRISPYEWTNPFPCIQEPEELENQFTLSNSFWYTVGALMQQGSEIAPISVSTRMAAGVWWFFTLIMVSCYTANLAAFLTTENPNEEFTNIEELAQQNEIKYGAKKDGATLRFFNESAEQLHKQMFNYMITHKDEVIVDSSSKGVERAVLEKYAFLMESSQIEYETERQCSLTQIGKPIDDKGYGIAMKKGSWYLGLLSQNILKMQEEGILISLKRKWWKEKYAGSCDKLPANDAETLGMSNLGGVFLVLGGGVTVAMIIAILEQFFYVWSQSRGEEISLKKRLRKEFKFFLRCHGTNKPATFEDRSGRSNVLTYE